MRLLVSTRNKLLLWDGEPHYIREKLPGIRYSIWHHFYGVTWSTEEVYVTEQLALHRGVVHVFDEEMQHKGQLPLEERLEAPHQILWWEGGLYITDASRDGLMLWDGSTRIAEWSVPEEGVIHPNSVWCDGERIYVAEHGKAKMPKRIRVLDLDFNVVGCIELPRHVFPESLRLFHGIHNVYIERGVLHTLSPQSVIRYELESGESDYVDLSGYVDSPHYTRGLARTEGRFYVGLSEMKERGERDEGGSLILVTDDEFNVLDILTLELTGGLHDIRPIDSIDFAHNRVRCPLLKGEEYGKGLGCNS